MNKANGRLGTYLFDASDVYDLAKKRIEAKREALKAAEAQLPSEVA